MCVCVCVCVCVKNTEIFHVEFTKEIVLALGFFIQNFKSFLKLFERWFGNSLKKTYVEKQGKENM